MHVIDTLHGGGAERQILETVSMLASRDIETSIVTLFDDDGVLDERLSALKVNRIKLTGRGPWARVLQLRHLLSAD